MLTGGLPPSTRMAAYPKLGVVLVDIVLSSFQLLIAFEIVDL